MEHAITVEDAVIAVGIAAAALFGVVRLVGWLAAKGGNWNL